MGLKYKTRERHRQPRAVRITKDQQPDWGACCRVREYLRAQLRGRFYDSGNNPTVRARATAGNPVLEVITNVVPDIGFQRPKASVSTSKTGPAVRGRARHASARSTEWMHESKLRDLRRPHSARTTSCSTAAFQRGVGPKPSAL